jgi:hypothetical protein
MKVYIPKTVRKTIIVIAILIVFFIAIGIIYVFITDRNVNHSPVAAPTNNVESSSIPKPTPPGANAQEGVAVESVTSPVNAGSNASESIITNAGSNCTIIVSYNGVQSSDSGLTSKIADTYGSVTWTWTVESSVPLGNWPIKVTCTYHGRSAVVDSSLQVIK